LSTSVIAQVAAPAAPAAQPTINTFGRPAVPGTKAHAPAPKVSGGPPVIPASALNGIQQFQAPQPKSFLAEHAPWLTHTFAFFFVVSAIAMVFLLAIQTTKQEGLSGTLGGAVSSAYKGRLGMDQQISRVTSVAATSFVIFATLLAISGI
jgi:protein translocase SecG subunit